MNELVFVKHCIHLQNKVYKFFRGEFFYAALTRKQFKIRQRIWRQIVKMSNVLESYFFIVSFMGWNFLGVSAFIDRTTVLFRYVS